MLCYGHKYAKKCEIVYHHRGFVSTQGRVLFNHLSGIWDALIFRFAVRERKVPVFYHMLENKTKTIIPKSFTWLNQ